MATVNGKRVVMIDGRWCDFEDVVKNAELKIADYLSRGTRCRSEIGHWVAGGKKVIDEAIKRMSDAGAIRRVEMRSKRLGVRWAAVEKVGS